MRFNAVNLSLDLEKNVDLEMSQPKMCRGVIAGVSLDVDMDEVCEETSANKAIRLDKTENGERSPSNSVLLIFEREELPEYTTIGFTRYGTTWQCIFQHRSVV